MAGASFYAWVTLVSKGAVDGLVVGLIRQGFTVGPLASNGALSQDGEYAALAALQLGHNGIPEKEEDGKATIPMSWCLNRVRQILTERRTSWHSIVIQMYPGTFDMTGGLTASSTWNGPNYFVESPPKYPPKSNEPHIERMDTALGDDK